MSSPIFEPFVLPNGPKLKNRIVKAAMEENMADVANGNQPSTSLLRLYKSWALGGAGMILSGHVMIDPRAMACPGDVVLAKDAPLHDENRWRDWVQGAKSNGAQFWLQINHPGRQVKKGSGLPTYAPSPIALDIGKLSSVFAPPLEMSEEQILDIIRRFSWTAKRAEELGADGVEIHAAHGYLLSQFLSPNSNKRQDSWGGSLENRARLLFEVVKAVRETVSPSSGVGIKINSADFQRGGFGGNVESPAMRGANQKEDKRAARSIARVPLVVTGGIVTKETAEAVVGSSENVLAGIATALGMIPDLPNRWANGESPKLDLPNSWILPGMLRFAASTACVQWNLHSIGKENSTWPGVWPSVALVWSFICDHRQMGQYKKWVTSLQQNIEKQA